MVCSKGAAGPFTELRERCQACYTRLKILDTRHTSLYGFSEITLRQLSTVTGYHDLQYIQPRMLLDLKRDVLKSHGFLPNKVHPEVYSNHESKSLNHSLY